jgi:hypothetical protein
MEEEYKVTVKFIVESFIEEWHVRIIIWTLEGCMSVIPKLSHIVSL